MQTVYEYFRVILKTQNILARNLCPSKIENDINNLILSQMRPHSYVDKMVFSVRIIVQ